MKKLINDAETVIEEVLMALRPRMRISWFLVPSVNSCAVGHAAAFHAWLDLTGNEG